MQIVRKGPDVPDALLQAHEEARVIFFTGAGISYPAGLPLFGGLVDLTCAKLRYKRNAIEERSFSEKRFDATLDLIESHINGGRIAVRKALASVLVPKLKRKGATRTHEALLTLARTPSGDARLVTTNFDRIFETVMARSPALRMPTFVAPFLPIAKRSRWNGLVYLHGRLPSKASDTDELQRIVISSGDFGLAYLTERWASRFVGELFRQYVVCFVGYSINDPVLRYMMDALAADRRLGEATPLAYAFAPFYSGEEGVQRIEWKARGVTPVLYEVLAAKPGEKPSDHSLLHETLIEWANTYRVGSTGKESIVDTYAIAKPTASTQQDDYVGRMVWALSDRRGLAALRFAEFEPLPSLDWLEPFTEQRFGHSDLIRFQVTPEVQENGDLKFSLLNRPTPYGRAPQMHLLNDRTDRVKSDQVMVQMARWLARHLADPKLLLWVCSGGGPGSLLGGLISDALEKPELSGRMRTLWGVVLSGRVGRSVLDSTELYNWIKQLEHQGALTSSLRVRLRHLLAPRVTFKPKFRMAEVDEDTESDSGRIREIVDFDLHLGTEYVHTALREASSKSSWEVARAELLSDFTDLLRDAMDVLRDLQGADDESDFSYIHRPSIAEHPQNQDFPEWTALIDLIRDAWRAVAERDPERARLEVERWQAFRYPIFRRLTFFAAASPLILASRSLAWLLEGESHWWLWSPETQRETLQLLLVLPPRLNESERARLLEAILVGPPREKFKADLEPERWQNLVDNEIWLHLTQWERSNTALNEKAAAVLENIRHAHPEWERETSDRDEFAFWMGSGEERRELIPIPEDPREWPQWLREHGEPNDFSQRDRWQELCRSTVSGTAAALTQLGREGYWPAERWREALQAWTGGDANGPATLALQSESWRLIAESLLAASDKLVRAAAHSISWWMRSIAKTFAGQEDVFLALISRMLRVYRDEVVDASEDVVGSAINHPVGQVIEAAIEWWFRTPRQDDDGIGEPARSLFAEVCDVAVSTFRYGRVILVSRLIPLFRIDPDWATRHLCPLLDWSQHEAEASAAWEAFLWSPRFYPPLFEQLKGPFLASAHHYEGLGRHREQYAAFLTYVALNRGSTFTAAELTAATEALPPAGQLRAVHTLVQTLRGAGEKRVEYWRQNIVPYFNSVWPGSSVEGTAALSAAFARLAVAADAAFPEALALVSPHLQPLQSSFQVVHELYTSGLAKRFPREALTLLSKIFGTRPTLMRSTELQACLDAIAGAERALGEDREFRRLSEAARGA